MSKWYNIEINVPIIVSVQGETIGPFIPWYRMDDVRNMLLSELNIQGRVKHCKYKKKWIIKFKCPIDAMAFKLRWL